MAYPSDLVRTKDWGNEILTDTDLEGQLDLIIDWVMAFADETTGHSHDATANEGPKIGVANLDLASAAQGDVIYHNGTNLVRLAAGTANQALRTNGAAANPAWEDIDNATDLNITSQAAGDLLRHDGANWVRLADGTADQVLESDGAGALTWVSTILSAIEDYGTSASASTSKNSKDLMVCYGRLTIAANTTSALSNLPFTAATTYVCFAQYESDSTTLDQNAVSNPTSGAACNLTNAEGTQQVVMWVAIGT